MCNRTVVRALYKSLLRASQRLDMGTSRALAECEIKHELEAMRCSRTQGHLLSQLVRDNFRQHTCETNGAAVEALVDRGFLALRRLASFECEALTQSSGAKMLASRH